MTNSTASVKTLVDDNKILTVVDDNKINSTASVDMLARWLLTTIPTPRRVPSGQEGG